MPSGAECACIASSGGRACARHQASSRGGKGEGGAAADVPKYRGFFDCIFQVARSEGPTALYKGLLPRLMRIPPGQAIVWGVADQVIGYFEAQKA